MQNWLEFWRTMRRIGISDSLIWSLPLNDTLIQIYIIDCCMVRAKPNVWPTMRLKLRSIDYVAQLCGIEQSWSDNPALESLCKYVKKNNPGQGSDTLPITAGLLLNIVGHTLDSKVYCDLNLTTFELDLKRKWRCFEKIWSDPTRWFWYQTAISYLTVGILGLRGCECYENHLKVYKGYGLYLSDIDFYWQFISVPKLIISNKYSYSVENLHHIRFGLRNSKTGIKGKTVYLRMGRTYRELDPVIILYKIYCLQRYNLQKIYKYSISKRFLFSHHSRIMKLNIIKKRWKEIIFEMGLIDGERLRFHGTRKGFASSLQQKGVDLSRISYAGRWKLQAAIYSYLIHTQKDLIGLCLIFLYGRIKSKVQIDFDKSECDLIGKLDTMAAAKKHNLSNDFLQKYDDSLQCAEFD